MKKILNTIEVKFNKDVVAAEAAACVQLKDANDNVVSEATYTVEGKIMTITLADEVNTPGTYTLVIPEGAIVGAAVADAFSGTYEIVVEKFDVYKPRNTGNKTRNDRNVAKVTITSPAKGVSEYVLTNAQRSLDYTNLVNVEEPVRFYAEPGEELTPTVEGSGSWVHFYVFIDMEGDGFTASIEEGSNWKPAGDLVSYSFYNNDAASGESGWNSVGDEITGSDRNRPALPKFTAPEKAGKYRMRFKQDWCSIDPQGDEDGKFGDFKENGGQIIDVLLYVGDVKEESAIDSIAAEKANVGVFDMTGRKVEKIVAPGLYIVNGVKKVVK